MANNRGQDRLRIIFDFSKAPKWPELPEEVECGNNVILANGLTSESIILLKRLLSLPFYADKWPYQAIDGMSLADVATLYFQLIGETP
jgi:hypothetical protein